MIQTEAVRPHPHPHSCEFGDAVSPHLDRMFRAARRIVPSDDLAWDAVQTTLLRLWRSDADVASGHACAVLVHVVRLVSLEVIRRERRREGHESRAALAEASADDASSGLEAHEFRAELERLIESLPDECREVTQRRIDRGDDYALLAKDLDIPLGTVRSRLHRARRLLAARLEESSAA
ncbi:MAG: sigma-70 family RNA polymerase sigma factor [Planctomycetota bacterium JB042]